jgi:hypothetical protein
VVFSYGGALQRANNTAPRSSWRIDAGLLKLLHMSRRLRIVMFILGLIVVCVAAVLVVYALIPVETVSDQATVAPTLFVSP